MPFTIDINNQFVYYLKLQLLVLNAQFTYYKTRSNLKVESIKETMDALRLTIEVIKAHQLLVELINLYHQASKTQDIVLESATALRNFIKYYHTLRFAPDQADSKRIQLALWPKLEQLVNHSKFLEKTNLPNCEYCDGVIEKGKFFCKQNHQFARCCVTKLQLPLLHKNFCKQCQSQVQCEDILTEVVGFHHEFVMCPFCDIRFY